MQNLIEVVDNNFQITIKEKLPNSVQMQIKFFGFSAVPNKDKIFSGKLEKINIIEIVDFFEQNNICLLYTSPSPRDRTRSRMPSSA